MRPKNFGLFSSIKYLRNFITPLDILKSKLTSKKDKLKIGWCAPFPPEKNGAAATTYWFVNELAKCNQLEVYALPIGRIIEKKLFPNIKYSTITDKNLDFIIFFCLGIYFLRFSKKVNAKTIVLQTAHLFDIGEQARIEFEILNAIKSANHIFAVTRYGQRFYEKELNRRIEYVPLGIDTNKFLPSKKRGKKKKTFNILFQSRLCYYKGIKQFLEAAQIVLKEKSNVIFRVKGIFDKSDLTFIYLGDNNKIYEEVVLLQKKFKKKFPKNIIFDNSWSPFSEAAKTYQEADILVFPSNNEGFGVPIIEAMSCGIPVIALNKAPMNEFIQDNKTGFLINYRKGYQKQNYNMHFPHPEDIAKKIIWIIDHQKKATKIGMAARESILKNYNLQKIVKNLVDLLVKLKNEHSNSK